MGVFTADHIIRPVEDFKKTVARGFDAAAINYLSALTAPAASA